MPMAVQVEDAQSCLSGRGVFILADLGLADRGRLRLIQVL
jgi:hypothetical protein